MKAQHNRSEYIQMRISPRDKKKLVQIARMHNMTLSKWILSKVRIENSVAELKRIYNEFSKRSKESYLFAQLGDYLMNVPNELWLEFVSIKPENMESDQLSYVAAIIDQLSVIRDLEKPHWITEIKGHDKPYFGSDLQSLRLYLLIKSPVAFRQRNIFIDSSAGERV